MTEDIPQEMTQDQQLEVMNMIRAMLDKHALHPLDRKAVIIMLASNFVVTTNEILGGNRADAMRLVDNISKNIRTWVNAGIDSGGMRIDGVDLESLQ